MSNDGLVQVPPNSTGGKIDCSSLSVGGQTVLRQRIVIGDPTRSAGLALVSGGALQVVNIAGTAHMGQVSVTGSVAISNTVTVQGQVSAVVTGTVALSTGTNHIGEVNISATATVINSGFFDSSAGSTTLVRVGDSANSAVRVNVVAGTFNISGTLDAISATVNVAVTNKIAISATVTIAGVVSIASLNGIGKIDGISAAVVLAAGAANIGTINNISAAVVLAAGAANIGTINNISATVLVAGSLTIGGTTGGTSSTAGSSFTLIGGNDGSIGRVALMDAAGHQIISGTVALTTLNGLGKIDGISAAVTLAAGAAHIGEVNISVFPALVAGTAHIGEVNISLMPAVVLAAGAANIGTINNISAAVGLAAGTQHIGEVNISVFPALVAGTAHIGEVNISLMPVVSVNITAASAGVVLGVSLGTQVVLAAGTANIGAVSLGAQVAGASGVTAGSTVILAGCGSRVSGGATMSAAVAWVDPNGRHVVVLNHPSIVASATQGPQNKDITATAFATLVASAGANCVYITGILVTNGSSSLTGVAFAGSDSTAAPQVVAWLAASGGGFNKDFHPPWKLSAGTALQGRIFPAAALTVTSVISFYVGP